MKIREIIVQYRRDFVADYECENCGYVVRMKGYDDANFHENVIPDMICPKCGEKAPDNYRPLTTKYPEGYQV
jgi:rubredoxin